MLSINQLNVPNWLARFAGYCLLHAFLHLVFDDGVGGRQYESEAGVAYRNCWKRRASDPAVDAMLGGVGQ